MGPLSATVILKEMFAFSLLGLAYVLCLFQVEVTV